MLGLGDLELGRNIYLKGFSKSKETIEFLEADELEDVIAIITDLTTSGIVKVKKAIKVDGKWNITCYDGKSYELDEEPEQARIMHAGKIITNLRRSFFESRYDVIFPEDYDAVAKKIADGDRSYSFSGFINRKEVTTSNLVKLWKDNEGKCHGLTETGSHYVI